MARIVARNAAILADGRDLSARSNNVSLSITQEAPEVTCFTESTRVRVTGGLGDMTLSVDSFYDESASSVEEVYTSLLGASGLWGFFPAGLTACNNGREFVGIMSSYAPKMAVADAAAVSVTVTASATLFGTKILSTGTLVGTGASAADVGVDFTGSAGGTVYGILRYLSGTGTSPWVSASLQDSTNDSAWATIAVFTSTSIANTTQIQTATSAARYRRFKYIVTNGSANIVFTCGSSIF